MSSRYSCSDSFGKKTTLKKRISMSVMLILLLSLIGMFTQAVLADATACYDPWDYHTIKEAIPDDENNSTMMLLSVSSIVAIVVLVLIALFNKKGEKN